MLEELIDMLNISYNPLWKQNLEYSLRHYSGSDYACLMVKHYR